MSYIAHYLSTIRKRKKIYFLILFYTKTWDKKSVNIDHVYCTVYKLKCCIQGLYIAQILMPILPLTLYFCTSLHQINADPVSRQKQIIQIQIQLNLKSQTKNKICQRRKLTLFVQGGGSYMTPPQCFFTLILVV